eukprot:TRINITY_DN6148_c0_g1_i2.p1 TRINITY_DN6148_c0_g1~~TRINITY_DN6148_c0_g1_i2.p1  ORF type:complete len:302 (+),score=16.54 TRINITY_DN6148_c0_g1_i2:168-1073(+)
MVFYPNPDQQKGPLDQKTRSGGRHAGKPGSIMAPSVNFRPDQLMFDYDDIPEKAREKRQALERHLKVDRLGLVRPEWNTDTKPNNFKVCDRTPSRTLCRGQSTIPEYNFRAEVLPRTQSTVDYNPKVPAHRSNSAASMRAETATPSHLARPQVGEMEVNPRLRGKPAWDDRKTPDPVLATVKAGELQEKVDRRRRRMRRAPRPESQPTLKDREVMFVTGQRQKKQLAGTPVRQKPKKKDPNIVGNRRDTQVAKRVHTGTYSFSNIEQTYVWSCCMNADQHSLGCNVLKKYTHGWNYSGLSG